MLPSKRKCIMTTSESVSYASAFIMMIGWIWTKISSRSLAKVTEEKTKLDIADAIIARLMEENKDIKESKIEVIRSNHELIALNKDLIKTNEGYNVQVHKLNMEIQKLRNEINKMRIQMNLPNVLVEEDNKEDEIKTA